MAFWGVSENTIDSANRLIIPTRFRAELGDTVALMKSKEGCLVLYSEAEIKRRAEQYNNFSDSADGRRRMRRFYSSIVMVPVDRSNRIVIPTDFMEAAELKTEVTLVGESYRIELWDREAYRNEKEIFEDPLYGEDTGVYL